MTAQKTAHPVDAQAGLVDTATADLTRATESSARATQAVRDEERRARVDRSAEQQQRVEDARRDQIAAEAFESALDESRL